MKSQGVLHLHEIAMRRAFARKRNALCICMKSHCIVRFREIAMGNVIPSPFQFFRATPKWRQTVAKTTFQLFAFIINFVDLTKVFGQKIRPLSAKFNTAFGGLCLQFRQLRT
jgi:hypothetical protein